MAGLQGLLQEIRLLEERVADEVARDAEEFGYSLRNGRAIFDKEIIARHRELANRISRYLAESSLLAAATAPLVYSLFFPLVLLDGCVWIYQLLCFPVYRVPKVRRSDYFVLDRHQLKYLNPIERTHCLFCSYATGLIAYIREIAARTEQYWCPIKHAQRLKDVHSRYYKFLPYGNAEGYAADLEKLRREFSDLQ
ncbi:MAG: hypothetical protein HKM88_09100 [Halobacteria archaeon]|nr:hypothetical protein [Halobacteria archaeon]